MNIALIIAGGRGERMGLDVPKQFLRVQDRYVITYTMQAFQDHPEIDAFGLVCLSDWKEAVWENARQYGLTKLAFVVEGGRNGQDSIRNGLIEARKRYHDDDIILIHDGVRPMVSQRIISDCIASTREHGNAITCIPCAEAMLVSDNGKTSCKTYPRSQLQRTQTPQSFYIKDIWQVHQEALVAGNTNSISSCTLMIEMGRTVHFIKGSEKNLKLTTIDDLEIFQALLAIERLHAEKD